MVSREELYSQVWSEAAYKVAERYGLSGRGLAKVCERYRIPRPERGYWAKLGHGKAVKQAALPPVDDPRLETVVIEKSGQEGRGETKPSSPAVPKRITLTPNRRLRHPLVKPTRDLICRRQRAWPRRRDEKWVDPLRGGLDLRVCKQSLYRALRILDALLCEFDKRGWKTSAEPKKTVVIVDGGEISFRLRERSRKVPRKKDWEWGRDFDLEPNGELWLEIRSYTGGRPKWADGKKQRVEDVLGSLVAGIKAASVRTKENRAERERWAEERRRREAERIEQRQRIDELRQLAGTWEERRRLQMFVRSARLAYHQDPESFREGFGEWLEWADRYVKGLNPLR